MEDGPLELDFGDTPKHRAWPKSTRIEVLEDQPGEVLKLYDDELPLDLGDDTIVQDTPAVLEVPMDIEIFVTILGNDARNLCALLNADRGPPASVSPSFSYTYISNLTTIWPYF